MSLRRSLTLAEHLALGFVGDVVWDMCQLLSILFYFFKECLLVHWKLIWFSFSYSVDGKQQTDGGEIRQKVHSNALKKYDAHPAFEFSREVLWWLIAFRRFGLKWKARSFHYTGKEPPLGLPVWGCESFMWLPLQSCCCWNIKAELDAFSMEPAVMFCSHGLIC